MAEIVKAGENLFLALGFPPHEAKILQLRAELMGHLRLWIQDNELTQSDAAERLGITQARVSDLVRGQGGNACPLGIRPSGFEEFARSGNSSQEIPLSEMNAYIKERFHS